MNQPSDEPRHGRPESGRARRGRAPLQLVESRVGGSLGVFQGARAVDLEVGVGPLLRDRQLRLDPRPRRALVEPVARAQPRELLLRGAVHDQQAVEAQVHAALDQERRVGHQHASRPRAREARGPAGLGRAHARVHDAIEALPRRGVVEHQRAERRPVERAGRVQHGVAEGGPDLRERLAAGRGDRARDGVEVERAATALGQPAQHERLAARDPARESHPQHARPQLAAAAARTVFAINIAIVSGPTPPGTGVSAPATADTCGACTSPTST